MRGLDVFIIAVLSAQTLGLLVLLWNRKQAAPRKLEDTVRAFKELYAEMDGALNAVTRSMDAVSGDLKEQLGQIRALAINGAIEAGKDPDKNKKIQHCFDEISRVCMKTRGKIDSLNEDAKNLNDLDELVRRVTADAFVFSPAARNKK